MFTILSSFKNESANCKVFFDIVSKSKKFININEVVVVDNGSNDNTFEILKLQKIKDTKIKVLKNNKLSGYGDGFTRALENSTNKFLITLHSDNQFRLDSF